MKYVLLVSHGNFAQGLHSVLNMLAGKGREDILSISLEDGMSVNTLDMNMDKLINKITQEDEVIVFSDIIGGSPLTVTLNVLSRKGLLKNTTAYGGMNLPLVLNAVLAKDSMTKEELSELIIKEAKDSIKEFALQQSDNEDDI